MNHDRLGHRLASHLDGIAIDLGFSFVENAVFSSEFEASKRVRFCDEARSCLQIKCDRDAIFAKLGLLRHRACAANPLLSIGFGPRQEKQPLANGFFVFWMDIPLFASIDSHGHTNTRHRAGDMELGFANQGKPMILPRILELGENLGAHVQLAVGSFLVLLKRRELNK